MSASKLNTINIAFFKIWVYKLRRTIKCPFKSTIFKDHIFKSRCIPMCFIKITIFKFCFKNFSLFKIGKCKITIYKFTFWYKRKIFNSFFKILIFINFILKYMFWFFFHLMWLFFIFVIVKKLVFYEHNYLLKLHFK